MGPRVLYKHVRPYKHIGYEVEMRLLAGWRRWEKKGEGGYGHGTWHIHMKISMKPITMYKEYMPMKKNCSDIWTTKSCLDHPKFWVDWHSLEFFSHTFLSSEIFSFLILWTLRVPCTPERARTRPVHLLSSWNPSDPQTLLSHLQR